MGSLHDGRAFRTRLTLKEKEGPAFEKRVKAAREPGLLGKVIAQGCTQSPGRQSTSAMGAPSSTRSTRRRPLTVTVTSGGLTESME